MIMVVQGNCASMEVLRQAGVKEADLLIAMAGADEVPAIFKRILRFAEAEEQRYERELQQRSAGGHYLL